jgi:DNA-binding protein YbaB
VDGDTQAQLRQAAEYAAAYQGMLMNAESVSVPGAEGADGTGTVEVKLGTRGIPVSVRIGQHWLRSVGSERLGTAVLEACAAASIARAAAAAIPLENVLNVDPGGTVTTTAGEPEPPRQIEALVADVIRLLDNVSSATVDNVAAGTAAMSRVEVTVSQDAVLSCVVDPAWAARQDAAAIEAAMTGAFASAADALDRTVDADPVAGLEALYHESMSMLGQLRREGR